MKENYYGEDKGTSRERLQSQQAEKLSSIPTIWNSNEFFLVAARLLAVAFASNISASLIQIAAGINPAIAIWAGLIYLLFAGGSIIWMLANHQPLFHRWSFIAALWVGLCFGLSIHEVLGAIGQ